MPPKSKFSKDDIVEAALSLIRTEGFSSLTARALGAKLGCSARPIFTVFQSMEEVQQSVIEAAKGLYKQYVKQGLSEKPAFKGVGKQYILFSINEPKLFQILFMAEQKSIPPLSGILPLIDDSYEEILSSIQNGYMLDITSAERIYHHLWIYSHGIATLCSTNMCRFTGEEISNMLSEVFVSLLKQVKSEGNND